MWGFGKTETQYGIRVKGKKEMWYDSKSARDKALRLMKKNIKASEPQPKACQRTAKLSFTGNPKDKCSGGKCKRNGYCTKHGKQFGKNADSLYDGKGRNKNTIRWDGERF